MSIRVIDGGAYTCALKDGKHAVLVGPQDVDFTQDDEGLEFRVQLDDGRLICGGHLIEVRPLETDDVEIIVTGRLERTS